MLTSFAQYKPSDGGSWRTQEDGRTGLDLPSITIEGLRPNTKYMARIAIYKDYADRSLGKSTGVIEFQTKGESNQTRVGQSAPNLATRTSVMLSSHI